MRLCYVKIGDKGAVVAVVAEGDEQLAVEINTTEEELTKACLSRARIPADDFTPDEAKALEQLRAEFDKTKTNADFLGDGRGRAQIEIQTKMEPLVEKERRSKVIAALMQAVAPKP